MCVFFFLDMRHSPHASVSLFFLLIGLLHLGFSRISDCLFPILLERELLFTLILYTLVPASYYFVLYALISKLCSLREQSNALHASLLGVIMSIGILILIRSPDKWTIACYIIHLSFFHWSEFYFSALYNREQIVNIDLYMFNHSPSYNLALLFSFIEYSLETFLFNCQWKSNLQFISLFGLISSICGEILRKTSLVHAGQNFNHYIEYSARDGHNLVTSGVYSFFRHPGYAGWFLFSCSTQLMLLNPVSLIGFILASWKFFDDRVYEEEIALVNMFGQAYVDYKKAVPSGVPFVYGVKFNTQ